MKVCSVSEMRALDRRAVEEFGIIEELLMENAGESTYFVISRELGVKGMKFVVFCGLGNNGGDGFVVARKIHSAGGDVQVFLLGDPSRFKGPAKLNLDIASRLPIELKQIEGPDSIKSEVAHCDCIIDAIFGTGLTRNVEGRYAEIIDLINRSDKTVFSLDIPSGVQGDTGQIMGCAVKADYTVTFGLPKFGNLLYPGYELCGRLYVSHISFPPAMYHNDSIKVELNVPQNIPARSPDGHKGSFGQCLFVAGASSYFGAPYFSAMSFLKAGGGYSRLAAPVSVTPFIGNKGSEIVFLPQKETTSGSIALENKEGLLEISKKMDMVVLGPGLSLDSETKELARQLARETDAPLLIDGDGISAVSEDLDSVSSRKAETVLTPHPGELSRLISISTGEIAQNRLEAVRQAAVRLKATVVLKGAHSLVGLPDGKVFINMTGNAGMATAGSGDVLTGAIAAMYCLGLGVQEGARKGVFVHGLAGDLAADYLGQDGVTAQDILEYLPLAVKLDREDLDEALNDRYVGARVV